MTSNILSPKYYLYIRVDRYNYSYSQSRRLHYKTPFSFIQRLFIILLKAMEELNGDEYERVLKYMETVNEENFQAAVSTMKQYRFNVEMAVNSRFQGQGRPPSRAGPPPRQQNDEEIVRKYIQFTVKKNQSWNILTILWDILIYILLALLSAVTRLFPESLYLRFFASPFEKIYAKKLKNKYSHCKLQYYLNKTKNLSPKSVLLVISPRKEHPAILEFLNNQALQTKIRNHYFLCCYVAEHEELARVEGSRESPQVIVLRWDIFEEMVEVGREREVKRVSGEVLDRWSHEGRNQFKRDGNVLVKYRNYIARLQGYYYEQEEEEEVSLVQRDQEQREIRQQNEAYRLVEEETRRNKERAAEEERARAELEEERRHRKMSIPDQPTSGHIVRISFRCPDGSTKIRNFEASERVELIYNWVQLNEEIQFQDERRQFEIMYSYPPAPLSSRKDSLLSEVFESSQEKVVIREL